MGADEEYLDNLLKSVTTDLAEEDIDNGDNVPLTENMLAEEAISVEEAISAEESIFTEESPFVEDFSEEETFSVESLLAEQEPFFVEKEEDEDELADGDTPLDIDAMLKELNLLDDNLADAPSEPVVTEEEENATAEKVDVFAEPFYSNDLDEELDEINDLLEKADNNEAIDENMLNMFAAANASLPEEEPFDLMNEINGQNMSSEQDNKKSEKERKRKEKEAEKAAKKVAKLAAKEQKKSKKQDESGVSDEMIENAATDKISVESQNTVADEESAFGNFQEVEEFDDIEALLGSLNMEDLEFATAPIDTPSNGKKAEPEPMLSMDDFRADEESEENTESRKDNESKGEPKKKEGLFKRFVDFLMEDDDDEEEVSSKKKKKEVKEVDANAEESIDIKEMEKRGKKAAKAKVKNGKKGQDDDDEVEDKKGKKKSKKPKKVKEPQSEMAKKFKVVDDGKKIGKAGGLAVVLLAASVFAVVMLSNIIFSPMLAKARAEQAFKEQDYEACYQEFYGWKLNESEAQIREFSRVVLKMERRIDAYEQYRDLRQKLNALDSLMRAVQNYDEIYQEALNCGAEGEVEARYDIIIGILSQEYGLGEKDAKAIAALNSDVEYTKYLTAIIEGKKISGVGDDNEEALSGLLPEEEELPDTKFSE